MALLCPLLSYLGLECPEREAVVVTLFLAYLLVAPLPRVLSELRKYGASMIIGIILILHLFMPKISSARAVLQNIFIELVSGVFDDEPRQGVRRVWLALAVLGVLILYAWSLAALWDWAMSKRSVTDTRSRLEEKWKQKPENHKYKYILNY